MRAARADDPAGFFAPLTERALDPLKRVPGFADEDADPARLAVNLRLQAAAGVDQPRVLARAEAGELAAGLDALKPSERPAQIRTLEARFGDGFPAARAEFAANGGAMTGALTRVASTSEIGKGDVSGGASRGGVSRGIGANVSPADPATAGQLTAVQEIGPAETAKATPPEDSTAIDGHLAVAASEDNAPGGSGQGDGAASTEFGDDPLDPFGGTGGAIGETERALDQVDAAPGDTGADFDLTETSTGVLLTNPATGAVRDVPEETLDRFDALTGDLESLAIIDEGGAAVLDAAPSDLTEAIGELVLDILPVTGELRSAQDAYTAFLAAREALRRGDLSEAGIEAAFVVLGVGGAVPLAGRLLAPVRALAKVLRRQGRRVVETTARAGRGASREWFARWTDSLIDGTVKTQGKAARVGGLSSGVQTFLKGKGIDPTDASILITDKRFMRMVRPSKSAARRVPEDLLRRMPELFEKPRAVLWEKKDGALLYVFDIPGDVAKGKFVVEVNFFADVQRGDKLIQRKGTFVNSASRVNNPALRDTTAFEVVEGKP